MSLNLFIAPIIATAQRIWKAPKWLAAKRNANCGTMNTVRACALCATPCPPRFRPPAPELSPDLDLRPGEPTRSTLRLWLQTCTGCGAVAPDLTQLPPASIEIVETEAYLDLHARPDSATPFLRHAMLCREGDRAGALLQAAWAADDAGDDDAARHFRRETAAAWGEPDGIESALRLIDILRRAGILKAAEECCGLIAADVMDERSETILHFQLARIAEGDTGRHLMSSALRPPARMPHVAHGKPKPSGNFLARFFRR